MVGPARGVGGSSSTTSSQNAAAAAAAEAARQRAEEARRAAEAARRAAEAAARAAAEAAKEAAAAKKAADAAKAKATDKGQSPEEQKKSTDAAKAAEDKSAEAAKAAAQKAEALQKAEEKVALTAKKAAGEMEKANEIAKREKVSQPFSEKDIKATQPTKNEVVSAFDGTQRKGELEKLLGTKAPTAAETQAHITANNQYDILSSRPENRETLDKLGIKNGQDLVKFGDKLEKQMGGEAPGQGDVPLKDVQNQEALGRIFAAAGETRSDEATKKALKDPIFASQIKEGRTPQEASEATQIASQLKLTEREFTNFMRNDSARTAARTLFNPASSPEKRLSAAMALGTSVTQAVPPEKVKEVLGKLGEKIPGDDLVNRANAQLPTAKAAVDAYVALFDPKASTAAKAKAGVTFANSLKNAFGAESKALKDAMPALRKLDGPARFATAGLTLADPNAKPEDRAMAALQLAGEAPGAWRDSKAFLQTLKDARVPNPEGLVKDAQSLANSTLSNLPADLQGKLTSNQVSEMARLGAAGNVDLKDLTPLLTKLDANNAEGLDNVLKHLNGAGNADEAKRFLGAVNGLDPKVAAEALKDPATADKLAKLSKNMPLDGTTNHLGDALKLAKNPGDLDKLLTSLDGLDGGDANKLAKSLKGLDAGEFSKLLNTDGAIDNLTKTVKHLDGADLDTFVKLTKNMDAGGIADLAKFAGKADPSAIKDVLKVAGPLLEHMDGRAVGKLGQALSKGLNLMTGLLDKMGAQITADVAGKVIKNLSKIVPGLGALPGLYDAAKLTKESADLYSKNKDLSFLAATGAKLNALDAIGGLILDATGVGVGVDLAVGAVLGVAELAIDIGLSSEKKKMEQAEAEGREYEAPPWVKGVNLAAAVAGGPAGIAHMVAHYGPKESFEMAKWGLEQGGKLAEKAWDVIKQAGGKFVEFAGEAVEALKNLGEAGVEKLEELAKGTGELAKAAAAKAQQALKDVARMTGEAAKKAAEAISRAVDEGVDWAKDAATELLKDGVGAMKDVAKAWANGMSEGAKAVADNLENLGEAGVEALKDLSGAGGAVAEYTVGKLKNLADAGIDAAEDALGALKDIGGAVGDLAEGALGGLAKAAKILPGI